MGNILFDKKNNRFWPIDFSNSYEHYYSIDKDSKLFVNKMADRWAVTGVMDTAEHSLNLFPFLPGPEVGSTGQLPLFARVLFNEM